MNATIMYPRRYRKGIQTLVDNVGMSIETAYAMMLMTAALMDLKPDDEEVVHIILQDCGVEVA